MNYLWIVEIRGRNDKWLPTVGAYLTRKDAAHEIAYDWRYNNPKDKFRIRKYVQEQSR